MNRNKPKLTIVGMGRLGTALAIALAERNYPIETLVSRNLRRARKAASALDANPNIVAAENIGNIVAPELLIIATPDDEMANVVRPLEKIKLVGRRKPAVFHTSGALSSSVLQRLQDNGWLTGSIHPLISVSDPQSGAKAFRNAHWCLEGDAKALRIARALVRDLGGQSFSIDSKYKALYHAGAVMASGQVVALFDLAIEMFGRCGLSRPYAKQALLPLLQSTIENVARSDNARALTGSFARGDIATIRRHLEAIDRTSLSQTREVYRLLGLQALILAQQNGLDQQTAGEIRKLLK